MKILAIESSCDETAAAVVENRTVLSSVINTQIDEHKIYGGVVPELASSNRMLQAFGERVARNAPVQGTAADIIKIAMINVYNRLKAERLDARLILQVHDELIVECRKDIAETVCDIIKSEMENAAKLTVPMTVDANYGKTWCEAKE